MIRSLDDAAARVRLVVFDFDGVFTDNRVLVMADGTEAVQCWRSDGLGLSAARAAGLSLLVISTETNPIVQVRCEKLKVPCIHACADKAATLQEEAAKQGVTLDEIAYMGNDVNDLGALHLVGLAACPSDAHPEVLSVARYVSRVAGGFGAVRDFCDYLVHVQKDVRVTR